MSKLLALTILPVLFARVQAFSYPASLTLTDDGALEYVLADIPFFSVGLVGFGVFTFFFAMRRINRLTIYIHLSVLLAFLASIFDLSQIIRRGSYNTSHNLKLSTVQVLIILRELGFAFSFGFRFFFFWVFVSEPPRGELPLLPVPDERRPNFITLDSESMIHSGSWARWSYLGFVLKWGLLLMTIAVPILQTLWRLVKSLDKFGPIYYTEGTLEIVLSSVFILKIFANIFMSPLTPRWKTLRDYSPSIIALLIGLGVGIGNILCFEFSDSTLGRFLQAVELYILMLFVLISAFYKMPVRSSVVAELVRRRIAAAGYNEDNNNQRQSAFSMIQPAPVSIPATGSREDRRSLQTGRPSLTQRLSSASASILTTRFMGRRRSQGSGQSREQGGEEGDQRRLWSQDEAERGQTPTELRSASFDQTPERTPTAVPGWRDPVFTSVMRDDQGLRGVPEGDAPPVPDLPAAADRRASLPRIVTSPDTLSVYTTNALPSVTAEIAAPLYARSTTDSPVYGLNGIIRNLQAGAGGGGGGSSVPHDSSLLSSARSSGLDSLIRQQQELDKSIAGLRSFSPTSARRSLTTRVPSGSIRSEFSLSNFPEPPFFAKDTSASASPSPAASAPATPTPKAVPGGSEQSLPVTESDRSKSFMSEGSLTVDDVTFQLVPPRMPAALTESPSRSQNPSVPTIARESLESVLGAESNRAVRLDSQGTQYDVTSFIGGLTVPGVNGQAPLTGIAEQGGSNTGSDTDSVVPATISALTRVQFLDSARPSASELGDIEDVMRAGGEDTTAGPPESQPPAPVLAVPPAPTVAPPEPQAAPAQGARPALGQGSLLPLGFGRGRGPPLPANPRGRLEISNPIPRSSGVLNERVTFQRPRPAPLALQNANDTTRTPPPDAALGTRYF